MRPAIVIDLDIRGRCTHNLAGDENVSGILRVNILSLCVVFDWNIRIQGLLLLFKGHNLKPLAFCSDLSGSLCCLIFLLFADIVDWR